MTRFGYRRRISNESSEPTKTDEIGTKMKLGDLVKRARDFGMATGPLKPIEALMTVDKKARDGLIHLVLLHNIGDAFVTSQFNKDDLQLTLSNFSTCKEIV